MRQQLERLTGYQPTREVERGAVYVIGDLERLSATTLWYGEGAPPAANSSGYAGSLDSEIVFPEAIPVAPAIPIQKGFSRIFLEGQTVGAPALRYDTAAITHPYGHLHTVTSDEKTLKEKSSLALPGITGEDAMEIFVQAWHKRYASGDK